MSKRYQQFLFFKIDNAALFKPVLATLADEVITSSKGALKDRAAIHKAKAPAYSGLDIAGGLINLTTDVIMAVHDLLPAHGHIKKAKGSDDVSITGVNMSFTVRGMTKVG